ncbi:hypothetical protein AB0H71_30065 [Nocardia sp. NPDC050697]|uniref:hypothetical protein n=1 Tax=Nocardia sp. NPDC050697 TaxID=3155158 RepID=UPI0033FD60C2
MGAGFYNHVDDPDEFWDDEPLVPRAVAAPPAPPPRISVGSSFVTIEVDSGCLPVRVSPNSQWRSQVAPNEASAELMAAYRAAVSERVERLCAGGTWPTAQQISDAATPDARTIATVLLETRTWAEYTALSSAMIGSSRYQGSGQAVIYGASAVTVIADGTQLRAIEVRSGWAATADPDEIGDELLRCADMVRSARPTFTVRGDYSRYSDADLEHELDRHRLRLLEAEVHGER